MTSKNELNCLLLGKYRLHAIIVLKSVGKNEIKIFGT